MADYVFHLVQESFPYKQKRVEVSAENLKAASQKISDRFPKWAVSMFWDVWPKKKS